MYGVDDERKTISEQGDLFTVSAVGQEREVKNFGRVLPGGRL
jgi:hypothetical protein